MSSNTAQWLAFSLYAVMFIPVVAAETFWLVRRQWCTTGRALGFSLATNGIGIALSSAIILIAFFVMFMLVMGPAGTGSNTPEGVYIAIAILALILPLFVLIGLKMLLFRVLKIRSGREAVIFSAVASIGLIISVLVIPTVAIYFLS
jgi:hypothetical protein